MEFKIKEEYCDPDTNSIYKYYAIMFRDDEGYYILYINQYYLCPGNDNLYIYFYENGDYPKQAFINENTTVAKFCKTNNYTVFKKYKDIPDFENDIYFAIIQKENK